VVGCLLIDGGLDYEAAIARIAQLRAGTRKAIHACPESPAQHRLHRERAALRRNPQAASRKPQAAKALMPKVIT
jgi:hypothetical protein